MRAHAKQWFIFILIRKSKLVGYYIRTDAIYTYIEIPNYCKFTESYDVRNKQYILLKCMYEFEIILVHICLSIIKPAKRFVKFILFLFFICAGTSSNIACRLQNVMMTSVTLPSTSGPIHAGYSAMAAEETSTGETDYETARPVKRYLAASFSETCKKRRKQSTPVRISASDTVSPVEGKLAASSPESELRCVVCHQTFNDAEHLQSHIAVEHTGVECKKESEDMTTPLTDVDCPNTSPVEPIDSRCETQWLNDKQNKEWMNTNIPALPFNATNPMFATLASYNQTDVMPSRQPIRIFNPDAYCDLCNKEFCNKYFLKTHKANKHGIYSDTTTSETTGNTVNIPAYAINIKVSSSASSFDHTLTKHEAKPQHVINPFCDAFPNPFPGKSLPKMGKSSIQSLYESELENMTSCASYALNGVPNGETDRKLSEDAKVTDESSSPRNVLYETNLFKNEADQEAVCYTASSKASPSQHSREVDLSNRLRRIGVMNPKAFCEICCKEYCNKYFLRTHKLKRHGIFIPDEKDKDLKIEPSNQSMWPQNTQTSPLNLIMSEQSNSDRKTTSPTDISCDICEIKFQNVGLAQLHNVSVHSRMFSVERGQLGGNAEETKKSVEHLSEKTSSADAISEDLQKLQTMILQLNDLDVNRSSSSCSTCSKEFENRYYLHAHMLTEHGILLDDVTEADKTVETDTGVNNNTLCDTCGKDMRNVEDMKKHVTEFHQTNSDINIKDEQNGFTTLEKNACRVSAPSGSSTEPRASTNLTPTSSYCEICNKELCNKYFMKTHMQRMHGIEIESGAQIGGVVCDVCNKELCSKYFLRVHKHNTHGIVEYGATLLPPRRSESDSVQIVQPVENDAALKPADLADLSHRYFTHFTEVCSICSRRFRSTKWLKAHLLSDHGQAGAEKWSEVEQHLQQSLIQHPKPQTVSKTSQSERTSPALKIPNGSQESHSKIGIQNVLSSIFGADETNAKIYHCSYCPFSTPLLPFLFVHERSHSVASSDVENTPFKCPVCSQTFHQMELLQHHMFSLHPFIPLPPVFNGSTDKVLEVSNESSENTESETKGDENTLEASKQGSKIKKIKRKFSPLEFLPEVSQSLSSMVKKAQITETCAIPQIGEDGTSGYTMQAFLLEEESVSEERRFMPSVVFLPVLQKQTAPFTVTFTLTPA